MGAEQEVGRRTALVATGVIAALAIASVVLAFAPDAPLVSVLVTAAFLGGSLAVVASIGFTRPLLAELHHERAARTALAEELTTARARRGFVEQLDTAIDMADSEDEVLIIVGRALSLLLPDRDNQLLLAPPDQPRVTWSIAAGPDGLGDPEQLGEPLRCSALSLGRTVTAESSAELDACPHLAQHGWEVSSLCVPIRVGDRHIASAHSAGPAGDLPDEEGRRLLELVTRRAGARIAALRAARAADDHVALDPLTRLPTHTGVRRRLRDLIGAGSEFSIAFCDIDGFADYNARNGTEAGDRALRMYADVLGATLRPGDLVARFSGDRFLCVFPDCSPAHAAAAMDRVRESLVIELAMSEMAPFTLSVGIGASVDESGDPAASTEAILEVADLALSVAKHAGGNRVVHDAFDEIHLADGPL